MDTLIVDIGSLNEGQARKCFPGSDFQKFLHNDFCNRLNEARIKLEEAELPEVPKLQGAVRELKAMLAALHADDSPQLKEFYGR